MDKIEGHNSKLECYTCHATWAPQCYGCHVKIDYSKGKQNPDYLKASKFHDVHENTGEKNLKNFLVDGKVTETRSYLRWENPALSINGEGRVSPTIPGVKPPLRLLEKIARHFYRTTSLKSQMWRGRSRGQNAITMSQVQPHTISKKSRSCEKLPHLQKGVGDGYKWGKIFLRLTSQMPL